MRHLISCTDGSGYSSSVYHHSAWAASRMGIGVKILHVLDPHRERAHGSDLSGAIGFNASAELTEKLVQFEETEARIARLKGTAILEDAVRQLSGAGITEVEALHLHGSLVDTLEDLEPSAELVVIGKRGEHSDSARDHLGGELQRVIRSTVKPVLVASRVFRPIERFLIAYDGGPSVLKAVDFVLNNPLLKGLNCHILRTGKVDDNARYFLEETAGKLRVAGFDVSSEATPGNVEEIIGTSVEDHAVDLLVMGAYGHSPIRQFILGSTTTTMVRTCPVPVLMFR